MTIAACVDGSPAGGNQWKFKGDSGLAEDSAGPETPEIDTSIPENKVISNLQPEEYRRICEAVSDYQGKRLDLTDYCRYRAHVSNYSNDRNEEVAREVCHNGTSGCVDDHEIRDGRIIGGSFGSPEDEQLPRCGGERNIEDCDASVAMWTTCAEALNDHRAKIMEELPECKEIEEDLYSDKERLTCDLPAACREFKDECSDFYLLQVPGAGQMCMAL